MLILGIDTSDKNINIALSEDDKVISSITESNQVTENLILFIDKLFNKAERTPEELNAIGIITGPGGYTGTRSGVVVAKTMAQFLNLPLVGFNKTEALLLNFPDKNTMLVPMTDIKRNEVFSCLAFVNDNYEIVYEIEPKVFKLDEWLKLISKRSENIILLTGEFSDKQELFKNLPANIKVDFDFFLKPEHVTASTYEYIKTGKASDYLEVLPFYVREAI